MQFLNNTHYWHLHSKLYNEVPDTNSFVFQSSRRESYYLRMFFEHQETISKGGKTFFVTFTYNDRAIPRYLGYPVFNYDHIRLITNGVISKRLYREYGCKMKYLCACESGDGGTPEHHQRGAGNNPHYHFIFNVIPVVFGSPCIDGDSFFSLCQEVWQGKSGYIPWQKARFGSVKPGKFGIEVLDNRAFKYVGKYCLKDSHQLTIEQAISNVIVDNLMSKEYSVGSLYAYYRYLNSVDDNRPYSISQFGRLFDSDLFFRLRKRDKLSLADYFTRLIRSLPNTSPNYKTISYRYAIDFHNFYVKVWLPDLVKAEMTKFKNKYSGKCRTSKSLGLCGMSQILDPDSDPYFKLNENNGPKIYKLPLYYIRHLYYNVITCPVTGNPLYVLNRRGQDLKLTRLHKSVSKLYNSTLTNVSTLIDNKYKFFYKYDGYDVLNTAQSLRISTDYLSIVYKYSVYSIVYKHRIFSHYSAIALSPDFKFADVLEDYDNFLQTDRFKLDFETNDIKALFEFDPTSRLFAFHQVFAPYKEIFDFLDEVNHYISSLKSEIKKSQFAHIAEENRKMSAYEVSQYTY